MHYMWGIMFSSRSRRVLFHPEGIYFPILTGGLYIIPLIIQLLVKTIKYILPKYFLWSDFVAISWLPMWKKLFFTQIKLLSFRCCIATYYLLTSSYTQFLLQKVNGLLVEWYERCKLETQNHCQWHPSFFAAVIIKKYQTSECWDGPFSGTFFFNILRGHNE